MQAMAGHAKRHVRLGMLTPSSNTVLEPATAAMLAGLPEVSAHFGRFRVTEIALSGPALAQFDDTEILRAAELLADARVDVIAWNGTSAGWLGFEADHRLCRRITEATGVKATTSMLALNKALKWLGARRLGFVTPYLSEVQARIVANYQALGFECAAERHGGQRDNFSFSEIGEGRIAAMVRDVASAKPDAVAVVCTNMRAAPLAEALERELGIPVLDTVALAVWSSLLLAGVDAGRVEGWGRLFRLAAGQPRQP